MRFYTSLHQFELLFIWTTSYWFEDGNLLSPPWKQNLAHPTVFSQVHLNTFYTCSPCIAQATACYACWRGTTESLCLSTRLIQMSFEMKTDERDKQFFPVPQGGDTEWQPITDWGLEQPGGTASSPVRLTLPPVSRTVQPEQGQTAKEVPVDRESLNSLWAHMSSSTCHTFERQVLHISWHFPDAGRIVKEIITTSLKRVSEVVFYDRISFWMYYSAV